MNKKECSMYSNVDFGMGMSIETLVNLLVETNEDRIARLTAELDRVTKENDLNYEALMLLKSQCQKYGFNPFPGEGLPLTKAVKDMTREELEERNKEMTSRIQRKAKSADAITMEEAMKAQEELVKNFKPDATIQLLSGVATINTREISAEDIKNAVESAENVASQE